MGLFHPNYDRPGPGIPKGLPPKKGIALFWDILKREFTNLVSLNLCFLFFSIPIITIGPAYAAMTKITMRMVWDQNVYVFRDFWQEFKANFRQSFPVSLVQVLFLVVLAVSGSFYWQAGRDNPVYLVLFGVLFVICFLLALMLVYLYPMLVTIDLPIKAVLKNCLILGLCCLKQSLPCVILNGAILLAVVLFFPYSTFPCMILVWSLFALIDSIAAWPGIQKYVVQKAAEPEEKPENDR